MCAKLNNGSIVAVSDTTMSNKAQKFVTKILTYAFTLQSNLGT